MIEFRIAANMTEIRDKTGNNVIGQWYDNQHVLLIYEPAVDAAFIDACEPNNDGTYRVKLHVNHYVEWVQICPLYGLWRNVTTIDNLPDENLYLKNRQDVEMDNVEVIYV